MKNFYQEVMKQKPEDFLRDVGISIENFQVLVIKIKNHIRNELDKKPIKKRGLKTDFLI